MAETSSVELVELKAPSHWSEILESEPESVTKKKIKLARKLGVPAVLFSNKQAAERVAALTEIEKIRQVDASMEILYLALQNGGSWLAHQMYGEVSRAARGKIYEDTYGIKVHTPDRVFRSDVSVTKGLHKNTTIDGRHVTFIDSAIRHGTTLRFLGENFDDRSWTIHHARGGSPRSISAITMTAREDVDLATMPIDVSVGCITPESVRTSGCGADDIDDRFRHDAAISLALHQQRGTEEQVAAVLEQLGERAVLGIDDIQFVDAIR